MSNLDLLPRVELLCNRVKPKSGMYKMRLQNELNLAASKSSKL